MNKGNRTIEAVYSEVDLAVTQFDDAVWANARPTPIARYWSGEEAPPSRHAEARLLWSNEALSVRFLCTQLEPLIVSSTPQMTKKTIGLWDRDVCEIFIAPNPEEPNRYFEFEAAATGEWVDLAIYLGPTERETDQEFHSGMTTAARISESQLTINMRIPWSTDVPKPKRGDAWRVNLFRCVGTGNERYLAWLPTHTVEPNFHVPEAFGYLYFS